MKHDIDTTHWNITTANQKLKTNLSAAYWLFLIKQLNYQDVRFDQKQQTIVFASYVPCQTLLQELLNEVDAGNIAVAQCQSCQQYFDINTMEGIFGDPDNLQHFICKPCATQLSAFDFYTDHLKT